MNIIVMKEISPIIASTTKPIIRVVSSCLGLKNLKNIHPQIRSKISFIVINIFAVKNAKGQKTI